MSRRAPALNGREVDAIVNAIRARPFASSEIAEQFHVSPLTVERIARVRGVMIQHGATA